ncbi:MAG: phosphoribosylformylglycinamidine synthase subunit PurL [Candidatus Altarchaeum sp.]|nr:phosphoribosylformylglycinamidine synthase subunit PurL [Candidatus Altarchaeum sp.]
MQNFIFVGLKEGLTNTSGENLRKKILNDLHLNSESIKVIKIVDCYLIDRNLSENDLNFIAKNVFADKITQNRTINESFTTNFDKLIWISFKPGVTDNVGKTAKEAIIDVINKDVDVYTSKQYFFKGNLSKEDAIKISKYLSNELIQDSKIFENGKVDLSEIKAPKVLLKEKIKVREINLNVSDEKLMKISKERVLALNLEEMNVIKAYFKKQNRNPTDVEIECIAQTWSEHCKHKIFNAEIYYNEDGKEEKIESLFKNFVFKVTEEIKRTNTRRNEDLISVFSDNAGIVKFNENFNISIKVETHNTPSALDPYGGALTGILGVNRDIMGVGLGAKPIANTNVFCFANPFYDKNLPTKILHPKQIFEGVVKGIEDGGNKSGIPTVNGAIVFDDRFLGKPLVFCGTIGIMPRKIKFKGKEKETHIKEIRNGDYAVMVGGKVGKDGIHGATFSSEELHEGSPVTAVQIGDTITQKNMLDFLIDARAHLLYVAITDNGAGGLSSSIGELAEISNGCEIELEKVPLKYAGLQPWEILVSESQERMSVVLSKENLQKFLDMAEKYNIEATVVGKFTNTGKFVSFYEGEVVADIDIKFLHKGVPKMKLKAEWNEINYPDEEHNEKYVEKEINVENLKEILKKILSRLNIASKESIIRKYDHEVQGGSIIKPLMGKNRDGLSDGAVIKPLPESKEGVVIACGICPKFSDIDTYQMAANAVDEAIRNIICCGGNFEDISLVDNFCWPSPLHAQFKAAQLVRACKGLYDACLAYGTPLISGKDSMSIDYTGKDEKGNIVKISGVPTLLITAISKIVDVSKSMTAEFKNAGDLIYVVGLTKDELGAGEFYAEHKFIGKNVPKIDFKISQKIYEKVSKAIDQNLIESCHDCSDGGLAVALAESAFSGDVGIEVNLANVVVAGLLSNEKILFSESASRFIVSIKEENREKFENLMNRGKGINLSNIGFVRKDRKFIVKGNEGKEEKEIINVNIRELRDAWKTPLNGQ